MRIGLQVWGQFVSWDELMHAGVLIERLGFASLWSNDHFYPAFGSDEGPVFEGWMTLAGWAMLTDRIALGCLVSAASYRNPALLVKMATALDHASHGRITLGLGAGWHERDHRAFGYALLKPSERASRLEDACSIVRSLLSGQATTFLGAHYRAERAHNEPRPYGGRRMRLLIGGSGERFTLPLVARYADIWNGEGDPTTVARKLKILREHCARLGRDPAEIEVTVNLPAPCIRRSRDDALMALATLFERHGLDPAAARASAEASPAVGPSDQVIERLRLYAEIGVQEIVFDTPHPLDVETLALLAGAVREGVASAA